ncbi:hypothetical protein [Spiroplasma sp. BIUS-1]|uniref:hypothetical protein n=1 Tax=Spiroplasma sp. BIUS-1 TaxID=216964 RepID=UPI001397597C|nr:hypothetical protein [Spiroplasma sp. BIUS-1]QHX36748.1 hypothetical protein SBIUS_v1c04950 [Spiroplasma sp. BIUS-1]
MIKLLSLIASLSMTTTSVAPVVINTNNILKEKQEESYNLSVLNGYAVTENLGYFNFGVDSYKTLLIPALIKKELQKSHNIFIEESWIEVISIKSVMDNRDIEDVDIEGANGANKETWEIKIKASQEGIANNLIGNATYYSTIHHHPGDLNQLNEISLFRRAQKEDEGELESLTELTQWSLSKTIQAYDPYTALYFALFGLEFSPLYTLDEQTNTNRLLTQEDIDKAINENELMVTHIYVRPNDYGKSKGIFGSAKLNLFITYR